MEENSYTCLSIIFVISIFTSSTPLETNGWKDFFKRNNLNICFQSLYPSLLVLCLVNPGFKLRDVDFVTAFVEFCPPQPGIIITTFRKELLKQVTYAII